MRKFFAVIFALAVVFALVAFGEYIPKPSSLRGFHLLKASNEMVEVDTNPEWPQRFEVFPAYNGAGEFVNVTRGENVMLRNYKGVSRADMEQYMALLQKEGFELAESSAVKIDGEQQYRFEYFATSQTKYQLTYLIEDAPPPPPLLAYEWKWRETINRSTYFITATAQEDDEMLIHSVEISARCQTEWAAKSVEEIYKEREDLTNVKREENTVTAVLRLSQGMSGAQVRDLLNDDVDSFTEEITEMEPAV